MDDSITPTELARELQVDTKRIRDFFRDPGDEGGSFHHEQSYESCRRRPRARTLPGLNNDRTPRHLRRSAGR